jgi:branched-chain amino acid transport system substrate-binding protein
VWWSPNHPFNSSLTQDSAKELADGYTAATGRPWTQPIGFKHALFEVAADVIGRTEDLDDPMAITAAIAATKLNTIVGNVDWSTGPVPNVSKTPLVGGQWQRDGDTLDLKIVANAQQPDIATTGELKLLG